MSAAYLGVALFSFLELFIYAPPPLFLPKKGYFQRTMTFTRNQTGGCQGKGVGGGMDWKVGTRRRKVFYIEWINRKVLPSSKRNCIQYSIINHNEKEHIYLNHFSVPQKLTQYCKLTIPQF